MLYIKLVTVLFTKFLCWGGSSIEQPFQLLVVDFSWIIGYFTRSAFTIRAIGGSEFYRIFLSDHPLIYSEHQVSVESDLVRTSTIGYPGPVVRVGLHDSWVMRKCIFMQISSTWFRTFWRAELWFRTLSGGALDRNTTSSATHVVTFLYTICVQRRCVSFSDVVIENAWVVLTADISITPIYPPLPLW